VSPHRQPSDVWGIDPSQSAYCADLLCSVNDVESSRIFPSLWPRATTCNPTLQHPNPLDCDFVKAEFTTSCHWRLLYINWYNIEVPTVDLRWVPLCAFPHFSIVFQKKIVCIVSPPLFPRELKWLTQYFSRVPTWNSRAVALSWHEIFRVTKDRRAARTHSCTFAPIRNFYLRVEVESKVYFYWDPSKIPFFTSDFVLFEIPHILL